MVSQNLLTLLKSFSKDELESLWTFLNSPYHNKSKKVIRLFSEIEKFYPEFNNNELTNEYLSSNINPGKKYNDSTMRDLISDLLKLLQEFLTIEELKKNFFKKGELLLHALIEKNQNDLFEKNMNITSDEIERRGMDSLYYYHNSILLGLKINNDSINNYKKTSRSIEQSNTILFSYMICIFQYFIIELIDVYIQLIINESKFKLPKRSNTAFILAQSIDFKKISSLFEGKSRDKVVFQIYYNLFCAFEDLSDINFYFKYKALVFENSNLLSKSEITSHFAMLIAYCILKNKISQNTEEFDGELFRIYNAYLKSKYFIIEKTKYIDESLYRNILKLSLRIKKFKWTLNFINSFSKHLHPEKRKNLLNFSFAEYYYFYGVFNKSYVNINKAFNFLEKIDEVSFVQKYDIKVLYLMIRFDLNDNDLVLNDINNYRKFLTRNKFVTPERKKRLNKFMNLLEKLIYIKENNFNNDYTDIYSEILNSKNIFQREWLLSKIKEIECKDKR